MEMPVPYVARGPPAGGGFAWRWHGLLIIMWWVQVPPTAASWPVHPLAFVEVTWAL